MYCWMIKEGHMCIHTHRNIFFFYMTRKKIEEYAMPGELKAMKMVWFYIFLNWSISQFSHSVVSNSLGLHGLQHARPPCPSPTPGVCLNSCPLCQWCYPTISLLLSSSSPALNLSQHHGLFQWVGFLHQMVKVLEFQLWNQSSQCIFRFDFF